MNEGHRAEHPPVDRLQAVFEDLEQQAAGMALAERDEELADRSRGEYAAVDLASRIHASLGRRVTLTLAGDARVEGVVRAAGTDWCSLSVGRDDAWLVRLAVITTAAGCSPRAVPPAARPVSARLGFGSALHRLAEDRHAVVVRLSGGGCVRGTLGRVGADFAEISSQDRQECHVVPFGAISTVRAE